MQLYRQDFVEVRYSYLEICPTEDDFENDPKADVRRYPSLLELSLTINIKSRR